MNAVSISSELQATQTDKFRKLQQQTASLQRLSAKAVEKQERFLAEAEEKATPRTKRVLAEMSKKHQQFNEMVAKNVIPLQEKSEAHRKQAYIKYLIQAWYHTKFTPEFEKLFGERLKAFVGTDMSKFDSGNKFVRIIEEGADEELGHELWALQDIERLGGPDKIDLIKDVCPEIRALVRTQFDRLNRMNFKGFLGYSFYLEYYVAKYSGGQVAMMESMGITREQQSFINNHHLVDQGHAADNIELLNFLLQTDEDVEEVLDNMEVIYALYSRMIERCFQ